MVILNDEKLMYSIRAISLYICKCLEIHMAIPLQKIQIIIKTNLPWPSLGWMIGEL